MTPERHREDIKALVEAINGGADIRLVLALATGFIEQNLPSLCLGRLNVKDNEAAEQLFRSHFNRLEGRIILAHTVGAIDKFVAETLRGLSQIRNKMLHHPSMKTVDHPVVAKLYDELEQHLVGHVDDFPRSAEKTREQRLRTIIIIVVSQLFTLIEEVWGGDLAVQIDYGEK